MGVKMLLAVALAVASVAVAAPAHAQDRRPCVSKVEYHSGFGPETYTRSELEQRWDVTGLGRRGQTLLDLDTLLGEKTFTIVYPRCGFSMEDAYYSVTYLARNKEVAATTAHHIRGTLPHGHP